MSLDFKLTTIKNYRTTCYIKKPLPAGQPLPPSGNWYRIEEDPNVIEQLNPVTSALVWITIAIDMGDITENNALEFYARVACSEKMFGNYLTSDEGPRPITLEDVKAHIGLHTNVSMQSWGSFVRRQMLNLRSNILRALPGDAGRGSFNRGKHLSDLTAEAVESLRALQEGLDEKSEEPLYEKHIALSAAADGIEETLRGLTMLQRSAEHVEALEEQQWDRLAEANDVNVEA